MRALAVVLIVAAATSFAGCGGGGSTAPGGATAGTVPVTQLAEKIGLVSNGEGEYRLDGCTAKALLASPGAVEKAEAAGQKVVTDPTGRYGIEIEPTAHCAQVMKGAVAILNVP